MTVRQAVDRVAVPGCPVCAGTDVRVALEGPTYPIYVCGTCHSNFCCPPARASLAGAPSITAPLKPARHPRTDQAADGGPDAVRTFGDVRAELHRRDAGWMIVIADVRGLCLVRTSAEGTLAEAKAKAERLVGYLPTAPWLEANSLPH
ncbi:MAG: hypothetical protein Q8L86_09460 [Vicinamibacterales bacterium]|nr:hypothetical protein [Vicinamibacterales bacterium]